ncbi:MetQ/NlpA family ABC transporter substrate-binding protein [Siminovitchia fortis]|uniref:Lipoprotein n=1 Tax=Siminovitchia fortis TaxID=254758 RepID=A0A443INY8_9BACI|nr:MetQ/NlpA family ABC transporter substrate-binding protein [Siminovitchia fortis]RWR07305.1 MetQ/NlpA family ABC transporter substrate-binding protein [Siminovitchia fortis]WHY81528.1 MetQ/NlpA family ABC transporter substrate-binding protein [Siminovitchia fortis]
MKKWVLSSLIILIIAALAACGGGNKEAAGSKGEKAEGLLDDGKLTVGVTAGPHEQVLEKVKELAAKQDLDIEVKVFTDYIMPNIALDEKELDLNLFQTIPYLEQFNKDRDMDLVEVGKALTFPMGIYSSKVKDVKDLPKGAKIGLPNDPTNGGRALVLFESAGLIKLKEGSGTAPTVKDVEENENDYELVELEASQLPRQLEELDAAAINTNFAIEHGLKPAKDSIFIESSDSPWVNVAAARPESKDDEAIQKFWDVYRSDEVKQYIDETFEGSVIPSW